ncbi:alpha/beta fold hydrolase [Nonomuraea sp. NPDC050328]|uniref:alpha/beta fold hydrolase n=1 Tax=Nonomuraea sp. NPDC050328 TaxID=3364361 RepID=UPI0037893482
MTDVAVFLHGIGSDAAAFDQVVELLPAGVRGVAWTLPGYAGTPPLAESGSYADALAAFLDERGIGSCHLVGSSIGALIAAETAARFPERVRSLLLCAPAPGGGGAAELAAREALIALGPERMAAERVPVLIASGSPSALAAARAATLALDASAYLRAARLLAFGDIHRWLAGVPAVPVGVLGGELDAVTPVATCARPVAAAIPGARLTVVPGCGHVPELEAPQAVAAELARLIAATLPDGAAPA